MSRKHRTLKPAKKGEFAIWANASPHEKERLRLIELRMGGYITKGQYDADMRAVDEAERKAVAR